MTILESLYQHYRIIVLTELVTGAARGVDRRYGLITFSRPSLSTNFKEVLGPLALNEA